MHAFYLRCLLLQALLVAGYICSGQTHSSRHDQLPAAESSLKEQNYGEAIKKAKKVFEDAVIAEDTLSKGESSFLMGKAFQGSGNYSSALEYFLIALKSFEHYSIKKADVLSRIGDLYYDQQRYKKALEYYESADNIIADKKIKKHLKETIGDAYLGLGRRDQALLYYQQCLDLTAPDEYDSRIKLYQKKGDVYSSQQDYDKALEMAREQLALVSNSSYYGNKHAILNNIGYLYSYKKDYNSALAYFKKSRNECLATNRTDSLHIKLMNMAAIYYIQGHLDSSLLILKEALKLVQGHADKEKEARVRNCLVATYVMLNQYSAALDHNYHAIVLARESKNPSLLAECYYKRSKILEKRGNTKEQYKFYGLYRHLQDSLDVARSLKTSFQKRLDSLAIVEDMRAQIGMLYKELENLNMKKLQLQYKQKEDEMLYQWRIEREKMAFDNERLKKYDVQRKWELTQKALAYERKAREITVLQKQEQELMAREKEAEARLMMSQKENVIKELELNRTRLWNFIGLGVILLSLLLFLLLYFRQRQNAKENKLKLANVEIQQRLLRSQMNPHFLFNSLHSIQGFINSNNSQMAERYLIHYADLMRSILENTEKEKVLLQDELMALRTYMDLEQMQNEDMFTYTIELNGLEEDMIEVPPMLIQPYVENAILHGLRHKEGPGELKIVLYVENNYLNCEILDNGIGREASRIINSRRRKEHHSVAMNITKERLNLLNKQENSDMEVNIEDLVSPDGKALGTKVKLKIALYEYI